MKFEIDTEKPIELEEAFEVMRDKLLESNAKGVVGSSYVRLNPTRFLLELDYLFSNRATDWIVERELKSTLKKIDPKVRVKKLN